MLPLSQDQISIVYKFIDSFLEQYELTDVERDDSLCLKIAREEADKTIVRQGMATTVSAGDDMENHYKNITHSIVYMIKSLRTIKAFGNVSIIDQSAVGQPVFQLQSDDPTKSAVDCTLITQFIVFHKIQSQGE